MAIKTEREKLVIGPVNEKPQLFCTNSLMTGCSNTMYQEGAACFAARCAALNSEYDRDDLM